MKTKTKSWSRDSKQCARQLVAVPLPFIHLVKRAERFSYILFWKVWRKLCLLTESDVAVASSGRLLCPCGRWNTKPFLETDSGNLGESGWTELLSPLRLTQGGERFNRTSSAQHAYTYLNHFRGLKRELWRNVYYFIFFSLSAPLLGSLNIHCRAVFTLVSILMVFPDLR